MLHIRRAQSFLKSKVQTTLETGSGVSLATVVGRRALFRVKAYSRMGRELLKFESWQHCTAGQKLIELERAEMSSDEALHRLTVLRYFDENLFVDIRHCRNHLSRSSGHRLPACIITTR